MSLLEIIKLGIVNLISDDLSQYVVDEDQLYNELIISMKGNGEKKISAKDAALLAESAREAHKFANAINTSQINSIELHASEMVIRAKTILGMWIKKIKANRKLKLNLDRSFASQGDLPKDHTVKKAESTNGKIPTVEAGKLKNQPREKGGRSRGSRIR